MHTCFAYRMVYSCFQLLADNCCHSNLGGLFDCMTLVRIFLTLHSNEIMRYVKEYSALFPKLDFAESFVSFVLGSIHQCGTGADVKLGSGGRLS
jgi:hypothetical protein